MSAIGRYAVVGNPIGHSLSPIIQKAFADQFGKELDYTAQLVEIDDFEQWVYSFFSSGGVGLNVTLPFKSRAFDLANSSSERAAISGTANFLKRTGLEIILADNTDGVGLVRDIQINLRSRLAGAQILVLGAGGAVKGVLPSLMKEMPRAIFIANRTSQRAISLAQGFSGRKVTVTGGGLEDIPLGPWDIILNGSSAGLFGEMPALPNGLLLSGESLCYDMAYGKEPTVFMGWAVKLGASKVADGLGMLVEQAAESYSLWFGSGPDSQIVIENLRRAD